MNGKPWVENRRFCLHVLRNLGFGKKPIEEHIKEEIAQLCDVLESWGGKANSVRDVLISSVSNNITALLLGHRLDYDDPKRHLLDQTLVKFALNVSFSSALDFLPFVRKLVSCIPSSKAGIAREQLSNLTVFVRKELQERSKIPGAEDTRNFMNDYLRKIAENDGGTSFNLWTLTGNTVNLFGAGSNTVRTTLEWHLLNCARDPEGFQKKLQQEVDKVVGRTRAPEWEDRLRMPYTMAVIREMLRWRTIAPLGINREAEHDTSIGGFHVPSGTVVLPNIWAVHNDPEVWEHPTEFDPGRFLNADHTKLLPKPAAYMPFTSGRRMCPGETLAIMEIFLYLATLMQRFTVLPKEGRTISMEFYDEFLTYPAIDQELRFVPR